MAMTHLAHSNVVQAVRAVEYNTLYSQSLGQILGCLCLACTSWPLWGSIQVQVECSHQGTVATICQWCDYKSVKNKS